MSISIPDDWAIANFGTIAEFVNGYSFSPEDLGTSGLPVIRIEQLKNRAATEDKTIRRLPDKFLLRDGDIVFSWSGSFVVQAWDRGPAWLNQHLFRVIPKAGVLSSFLLHLLNWNMDSLVGRSHGTTMTHITRRALLRHPVIFPSLVEQQRIAETLDAADKEISATKEISVKFKNITSAILNDLLFRIDAPARPLNEFLTARPRNGFSPNESESWTGVLALGLGCLTTEGFVPRQLKNVPAKDARYATARLYDGDLLISRSNTYELVGLVGRYRDVGVPCVYPDLMMKLTPNGLVRPEFLELLLRNEAARSQIKRMSQGTSGSMVKITGASLVDVRVRIPDLAEQDRVLTTFAAQTTQLGALEREIAKLRMIKQGLMEDLLTGRVRVSDLS
jgi:type I restriction enzyme, S subunit